MRMDKRHRRLHALAPAEDGLRLQAMRSYRKTAQRQSTSTDQKGEEDTATAVKRRGDLGKQVAYLLGGADDGAENS